MVHPRTVVLLGAALLALTAPARGQPSPPAEAAPPPPEVRGLALTLHSRDPNHDYGLLLDELPGLGANAVLVVVHLYQRDARSPAPRRDPLKTPSDRTLSRVIERAKALGLRVGILPIVLLERPRKGEWRGNLTPGAPAEAGEDAEAEPAWGPWFTGYRRELLHFARLAEEAGADLFSVGSELSSTERLRDRWQAVIRDVRRVFTGDLTYAANWDHFPHVRVWRELDWIGLSGYYTLADTTEPTQEQLDTSWQQVRRRLLAWRQAAQLNDRRFLFLELGYTSQDGCAARPWDYTGRDRPVDLAEQAACYRAFAHTWAGRPDLGGVFFYEWWGSGGPTDTSYTPRGKPALDVVRELFRARRR